MATDEPTYVYVNGYRWRVVDGTESVPAKSWAEVEAAGGDPRRAENIACSD